MNEFSPLLILLFFWVLIGLPVSMAKKAARQKSASQRSATLRNQPKAPAEAEAPRAPQPAPAERLRPLTSTLSKPDHDDSVYAGSLGPLSTEGFDPCHDEQLSGMEPVCLPGREEPSPAGSPGLALGWTGNDIVRGIVMSEILTRKHSLQNH